MLVSQTAGIGRQGQVSRYVGRSKGWGRWAGMFVGQTAGEVGRGR